MWPLGNFPPQNISLNPNPYAARRLYSTSSKNENKTLQDRNNFVDDV